MLFLANPKRKARKHSKKAVPRRRKARRRKVRHVARHSIGGGMARRRATRRRRRHVARRRRPVVRRRRRATAAAGVSLRRRGVTVYRGNPRRRRYRRNPGFGGGSGVVSILKTGVKDGAIILVSQIAARKAINLVGGFVPVQGIAGKAITGLAVPVALTLVARKVAPQFARLISAAAFAEGMRDILLASPVGGFLSDVVNAGDQAEEYGAWPGQVAAGMGAWPGQVGDVQDVEYQ